MQPAAIALKECHLDLRNDVRQKIGASVNEPHTCEKLSIYRYVYMYGTCVFRISILLYLCVMQYFYMLYTCMSKASYD